MGFFDSIPTYKTVVAVATYLVIALAFTLAGKFGPDWGTWVVIGLLSAGLALCVPAGFYAAKADAANEAINMGATLVTDYAAPQ